jgi:hypothetical protein
LLGKEAVKEQIQRVAVHNVDETAKKGMALKEGVFTYTAALGKGDAGYFTDNEILNWLQRAL